MGPTHAKYDSFLSYLMFFSVHPTLHTLPNRCTLSALTFFWIFDLFFEIWPFSDLKSLKEVFIIFNGNKKKIFTYTSHPIVETFKRFLHYRETLLCASSKTSCKMSGTDTHDSEAFPLGMTGFCPRDFFL